MDKAKKTKVQTTPPKAQGGGKAKPAAPQRGPERGEAQAPTFRASALSHRKPTRFHWQPDAATRAALAKELELPEIASLSFRGEFLPEGKADFRLNARLEAKLTQCCVITLAPVPAEIAEDVTRRFLADWQEPEGEEVEIPEGEDDEPLPEALDIAEIARESLELALPPYPRAEGAALDEAVFAAPGIAPIKDEELRPFAGLASLLQKSGPEDRETPAEVAPVSEKARNAPPDSTE